MTEDGFDFDGYRQASWICSQVKRAYPGANQRRLERIARKVVSALSAGDQKALERLLPMAQDHFPSYQERTEALMNAGLEYLH